MEDAIKVGDEVAWRGSYGSDKPTTAMVEGITLSTTPYCHVGDEVYSVKYSTLREGRAIVDLDNGHWAYANQIAPAGIDPEEWHKEELV
jgi:hypothetical protein